MKEMEEGKLMNTVIMTLFGLVVYCGYNDIHDHMVCYRIVEVYMTPSSQRSSNMMGGL